MPFFSKVFRSKDSAAKKKVKENGVANGAPPKPKWEDAWQRPNVEPEEVHELLRGCTQEIKSRGLDMPFLLLPFRPASDPSAVRTFVRNFFGQSGGSVLQGEHLLQELRMTEPPVICSVMKWCWSRLAGGVVTWEAYELFKIGEQDSNSARDAFKTFIPISVASDARTKIIFDFFDLLAAFAAHGKSNGFGGRKLSRFAGWWAFEHLDSGNGFDGGYKTWSSAADATSHLFFAYLRSQSADDKSGISSLPRSLQQLVEKTEYPPQAQPILQSRTSKVVMVVDTVSPTPFALLRRSKNFHYRDDDDVLQRFSEFDDPVTALTDECRRVLKSISSANDTSSSKMSTSLGDASWSRFEDVGFGGFGDGVESGDEGEGPAANKAVPRVQPQGLRTTPASKNDLGRPTTPSWADFLTTGFVDDNSARGGSTAFLPPDKVLPPINSLSARGQSSQSHRRADDQDSGLEPGELASINSFNLDDTFWWVWMTSLAGEEPAERKAAFGRCALVETGIAGGAWLVMEEIVKGSAPEPEAGAYIAEKKSRFGFTRRTKLNRNKSSSKGASRNADAVGRSNHGVTPMSKSSIAPDQHARIQAAAAALQQKQKAQEEEPVPRHSRQAEDRTKTNSILSLQPTIVNEAGPAMKWANSYDKNTIRARYLHDNSAGRGSGAEFFNGLAATQSTTAVNESGPQPPPKSGGSGGRTPRDESGAYPKVDKDFVDMINKGPNQPQMERIRTNEAPRAGAAPQLASPSMPFGATSPNGVPSGERLPEQPSVPSDARKSVERKPLPITKDEDAKPPVPNVLPQPQTPTAASQGPPSHPSSPEATHATTGKLRKKPGTGFKGFFNRKKENEPPRSESTAHTNPSAVAAARAALEAKAAQNQNTAQQPASKNASKRFSTIGRKRAPPASNDPSVSSPLDESTGEEPPTAPTEQPPAPIPEAAPEHTRPVSEVQGTPYGGSAADVSAVDPAEERHAEREFRSFDQGPMQDMPAFAPEDSPRKESDHSEADNHGAEHATPQLPTAEPPPPPYESASERGADTPPAHAQHGDSTQPFDDSQRPNGVGEHGEGAEGEDLELSRSMSPNDRWAQIRKNAAERAAQSRQSEEQSRQTDRTENDKTDDGDTSGEETIESRVARIKARVAELTGGMEVSGNARR